MLTALTQQIVEAFQLLENTNPEWLEAILNRPTMWSMGAVTESLGRYCRIAVGALTSHQSHYRITSAAVHLLSLRNDNY